MAKCPKCGKNLRIKDVRAECPHCGANIPNYNWEKRLNDDADTAEKSFARLHYKFHNFGSATVGSGLRIVRLICTFLPLIALILPLAKAHIVLPFYTANKTVTFLSIVLKVFKNTSIFGYLIALSKGELLGALSLNGLISIITMLVAVVLAVLNFFVLLIAAFNLRWVLNVILNALATVFFGVSYYFMKTAFAATVGTSFNALTGEMSFAFFVGMALFFLNMLLNIAVGISFKKQRASQPTIEQATEAEIEKLHTLGYGYGEEEKKLAKKEKKEQKAAKKK